MASFMLKVEFYFHQQSLLSHSFSKLQHEEEILTEDADPSSPRGEGVAHQCEAGGDEYSTVQTEVT